MLLNLWATFENSFFGSFEPESEVIGGGSWSHHEIQKFKQYQNWLDRLKKNALDRRDVVKVVEIAKKTLPNTDTSRELERALAAIEQDYKNLSLLKNSIKQTFEQLQEKIKKDLQEAEEQRNIEKIATILLFA